MAQLAQDRPSINVVQHIIVVIGLSGESLIIKKDVIGTCWHFGLGATRIGDNVGSTGVNATPVLL